MVYILTTYNEDGTEKNIRTICYESMQALLRAHSEGDNDTIRQIADGGIEFTLEAEVL